jgi:hypothetical protein
LKTGCGALSVAQTLAEIEGSTTKTSSFALAASAAVVLVAGPALVICRLLQGILARFSPGCEWPVHPLLLFSSKLTSA